MEKFDLFYNHFERIIINNNRRKVRLTNYPGNFDRQFDNIII